MTQFDPITWFLSLPPEVVIIFAVAAGLLATAILSFFVMKKLPDPENDSESGYAEDMRQDKAWEKRMKDMRKGWT